MGSLRVKPSYRSMDCVKEQLINFIIHLPQNIFHAIEKKRILVFGQDKTKKWGSYSSFRYTELNESICQSAVCEMSLIPIQNESKKLNSIIFFIVQVDYFVFGIYEFRVLICDAVFAPKLMTMNACKEKVSNLTQGIRTIKTCTECKVLLLLILP